MRLAEQLPQSLPAVPVFLELTRLVGSIDHGAELDVPRTFASRWIRIPTSGPRPTQEPEVSEMPNQDGR